jgi:hypothetical protein
MTTIPKNSSFAGAYLRFLQLAKLAQSLPNVTSIDANETALLEAVTLRWFENIAMTVRVAINLAHLGSPATLHKRITRLRQKELLEALHLSDDKRAKYLMPSEKALAMFTQLGSNMHKLKPCA